MTKPWLPQLDVAHERLYLAIVEAVARDVASGRLPPGSRLPPQRELADGLGVALGTVTRAYAEAERRGLIQGRGRRGTVVTGRAPERSALSALVASRGPIDLSANYPAPSLDPDLGAALRSVARETTGLLGYAPPAGQPAHREALAGWMRRCGVPAAAETVVITAGAQHGIEVTLRAVTRPGDEIACEALTYPGVRALAEARGLKLQPVPLDEKGLVPEALESLCRRRRIRALYTIPTLHNPTSAVLSADRKAAIAAIAERHDLLVIEDEIHRPFLASPPRPFVALVPSRAFLVFSPSKTVAGGLRIGGVVGPGRFVDALAEGVQASIIACPSLSAAVFAAWLRDGTVERTVEARRREARARQKRAQAILAGLPVGVRAHPDSAYLWLELPPAWPSERFVNEARERGVALASAELFAVESRGAPQGVRVALAAPASRDTLERGLEVLAGLLAGAPAAGRATL